MTNSEKRTTARNILYGLLAGQNPHQQLNEDVALETALRLTEKLDTKFSELGYNAEDPQPEDEQG